MGTSELHPAGIIYPIFVPKNEGWREGSQYEGHLGIFACVIYNGVYYITNASHGDIYHYLGELFGSEIEETTSGYLHTHQSPQWHKFKDAFGWEEYV